MQWERLTSSDFARAVRETNLCVLPLGVLEQHGNHLPLGTDYLTAHALAVAAAQLEPAVVFPGFFLADLANGSHFPGSFCLRPERVLELMLDILDEIHRHGFDKILVVNGHGGNGGLLEMLINATIPRDPGYTLYIISDPSLSSLLTPEEKTQVDSLYESTVFGHADEDETSVMMHLYPDDVCMDHPMATEPNDRCAGLQGIRSAYWWYGQNPMHQCGDLRASTAKKGKICFDIKSAALARTLRAVKEDTVVPELQASFQYARKHLPEAWDQ